MQMEFEMASCKKTSILTSFEKSTVTNNCREIAEQGSIEVKIEVNPQC